MWLSEERPASRGHRRLRADEGGAHSHIQRRQAMAKRIANAEAERRSDPTPEDDTLRDLMRAREDAVGLATQAKHRLKAFLLRQGWRYPGRAGWTRPYRRWLADHTFPLAPQQIALQEYRDT